MTRKIINVNAQIVLTPAVIQGKHVLLGVVNAEQLQVVLAKHQAHIVML